MTDPKRLVEGGGLGGTLLASARGDAPSSRARARAAGAMGLAMGTVASTSAAAGGATAGAAKAAIAGPLWFKLVAAGIAASAVAGGAIVATSRSEPPDAARSVAASSPQATIAAPPPASPTGGAIEELPALALDAPPAAPSSEAVGGSPAGTARPITPPRPQPPAETALGRELDSLDRARSALARGDAAGALAALDRHDREFSKGSLRTEAQVLRAEALLARGDQASARALARKLLASDPSGPQAKRLRTIAVAE